MKLYKLVTGALFPLVRSRLTRKYGPRYVQERLRIDPKMAGQYEFLVHAASVGEQQVIRPVVEVLAGAGRSILLTAATDTGLASARSHFGQFHNVVTGYLPFDREEPMSRLFSQVQFNSLVLVETEIWPLLIRKSKDAGARIVVVNGRLSDGAYRNYRRFRWLFRQYFAQLDTCMVRYEEDARRFEAVGVPRDRIQVAGNLKLVKMPVPEPVTVDTPMAVVVFGSTRDGEEEMILAAVGTLCREGRMMAVIAPRHPERSGMVAQLVEEAGLTVQLSSGLTRFRADIGVVIVANETGRLRSFYARADLCFGGGSLVNRGGQNFVEPLRLG